MDQQFYIPYVLLVFLSLFVSLSLHFGVEKLELTNLRYVWVTEVVTQSLSRQSVACFTLSITIPSD